MDMILGESPMVTGTWYNPKTGHSFTARDTIFEDDKMYVITTEGQRISYDMLQQYVQSTDPDKDHRDFSKPNQAKDVLPPEVANEILKPGEKDLTNGLISQEDLDMINGKNPMYNGAIQRPELKLDINTNQPKEDEDDMLVRRMLRKAEPIDLKCDVVWKCFPKEQLRMLEMLGVEPEKIAEYYMKSIDVNTIKDCIRNSIVASIENYSDKATASENEQFKIVTTPAILTQEQCKQAGLDKVETIELNEEQVEFLNDTNHEKSNSKRQQARRAKRAQTKTTKKTTKK